VYAHPQTTGSCVFYFSFPVRASNRCKEMADRLKKTLLI
jgi:hypothetical protein